MDVENWTIEKALKMGAEMELESYGFKIITGTWLTTLDIANGVTPRGTTYVTNPENGKIVPLVDILSLKVEIDSSPLLGDIIKDSALHEDEESSVVEESETLTVTVEGATVETDNK